MSPSAESAWYIENGLQVTGPFSIQEIQTLLNEGKIKSNWKATHRPQGAVKGLEMSIAQVLESHRSLSQNPMYSLFDTLERARARQNAFREQSAQPAPSPSSETGPQRSSPSNLVQPRSNRFKAAWVTSLLAIISGLLYWVFGTDTKIDSGMDLKHLFRTPQDGRGPMAQHPAPALPEIYSRTQKTEPKDDKQNRMSSPSANETDRKEEKTTPARPSDDRDSQERSLASEPPRIDYSVDSQNEINNRDPSSVDSNPGGEPPPSGSSNGGNDGNRGDGNGQSSPDNDSPNNSPNPFGAPLNQE